MTIRAADFERVVTKLGLKTRDSGDRLVQHSIRQQLKLNEDQLRHLIACTFGREDYIALLRQKGLLF